MSQMPRLFPLAFILLTFAILAGWYASVTPYRTPGIMLNQRGADGRPARIPDVGAPDERQHANYIRHLITQKSFPVLDPESPTLGETYQSHQPPLYYLLAATFGDPTEPGGQRTRFLNIFIGVFTLFGLFRLGHSISGRQDVGFAAASFGLLPGFLMLHGAITNDPLLICLCTWTCALIVEAMRSEWTLRRAVLIGVLIGAALLTKSSALALLPTVGVAWLLSGRRATVGAATLLLPLVIAAPWLIRNAQLYGDPLGLQVFKRAFTGSAQASMFIDSVGPIAYWSDWVLWWTARSFVGAFGYMDIFMPNNLVLTVMALVGVMLLAGVMKQFKSADALPKAPNAVLWAFFVVILALFVQFNLTYFQGQARYLYPAIAPIAVALATGLVALFGPRERWAWIFSTALLTLLNLYALTQLIPVAFQRILAG